MKPIHPGQYVREHCLEPRGLSVSAAAKLVGVGRPAFSNFLNGNAAATAEMTARIEVAFGFPQDQLLGMQSAYDSAVEKAKGAPSDATPYAPPFLGIKARDIEAWAVRNIPARSRFAVFLRTLVNSTARGLTKIDFPGNDDAERAGWDGNLEVIHGTPWIPEGISGWEFGTNEDPKMKADGDFAKSVKATSKAERDEITFVFVTPRHWPGKVDWVAAERKKNKWRDVRAYDSSDLEQWLEQSIAAQTWFALETRRSSRGVRTLGRCREDWANVAEPPLPGSLFAAPIESATGGLLSRLAADPTRPIVIAADSTDEALAFVAQFFETVDDPNVASYKDRTLVFDEPGVVKELATGTTGFIAIAHTRTVEQELAPLMGNRHCMVVYPRNAANVEPDVVLEPLNHEAFSKALEAIGYKRDDITRLDNESGRSLTVLRRRLARSPAIRTPTWATDHDTAASIIPFLWVGAWDSTKISDQAVLTLLADERRYEILERRCQSVTHLNDPPLWSVGNYRGVNSKIDLLFSVAIAITSADLQRFFDVAHIVLGEDDPRLDLPEDRRWAASIYGKSREFSRPLRRGIAETLVLLSVYGNQLFLDRIGFDCKAAARDLVLDLLTPLQTRLLEANDDDLAAYAEAAPDAFLTIIEEDLRSDAPQTHGLMRPAASGSFGTDCPRSGFLWALEGLAWNPKNLPRVAFILAQLSEIEITDNWSNKPINSLQAIFCAWMPQTAADCGTRLKVMKSLADRFPKIGWNVCIAHLSTDSRFGSYSHKPKWRNDGQGFGEPLSSRASIMPFIREMVVMALNWKEQYTQAMICDLVNCLTGLSREHGETVWRIVEGWAATASEIERASVREHIRTRLLTRRAKRNANGDKYFALTSAAKNARKALEPTDLLQRHEWLFRENWVEESADELADDDHDLEKRHQRIVALRAEALREIHSALGHAGVVQLSDLGNASYVVGDILSQLVPKGHEIVDAVREALTPTTPSGYDSRRRLIAGLLNSSSDESTRNAIVGELKTRLPEPDFLRVLLSAEFRRETWKRVDELSVASQRTYWSTVYPAWIRGSHAEAAEAVERLLLAKRPRAAFHSVSLDLNKCDPDLLFRLMTEVAKGGEELEGQFRLSEHYIEEAFQHISGCTSLTLDQKAGLEFAYIDALSRPHVRGGRYGIPNLEKYIEMHPEMFVQAIVWTYRRRDGGTDPPEMAAPADQLEYLASRGRKLLTAIQRIPGRNESGALDAKNLATWIKAVRDACETLGRLEVADVTIGEMLSNASADSDGVWPCEPVRDVLEELHSTAIMRGAHTGLFNARGAHWRVPGGAQERELANKYRAWGDALQYSHPFLSSSLLTSLVHTYERHAQHQDTEASVGRRLGIS